MRTPRNTYRLQITPDFDLRAATSVLPYLHDLGVDWVYLSPLLQATSGSTHGYDVVDPTRVDESRGGPAALADLSDEAHRLGMGVIVDIVPNHMGVADPQQNPWWWDLLRHGRDSAYADAFDVDWEAFGGRVMIPVLGDDGEVPPTVYPQPPEHYELVSWRRGDSELNYRRFFTITTLAGVRVEEPRIFEQTHREIRRWFAEGLVDGLRIDHPDGLRDPQGYLDDLARLTGGAYVLVEKILEPGEKLPTSWATAGTTGYDALGLIDRVLVDPAGQAPLDALESRLRGGEVSWADLTHDTKRAVADGPLLAEVRRIVREVRRPPVEEGRSPVTRPGDRTDHSSPGLVTGASAPSSTNGGSLRRRRRRAPRELPRLPLLPPGGRRTPRERLRQRAASPARPGSGPRRARTRARRPRSSRRTAVPADERDGDGQGRRGLRLLPLLAAHLAQRGRRRPGSLRGHTRRLPCGDGASASATGPPR